MARFIVVVLDSLGVGAMDDAKLVRPQDVDANTALHILASNPNYYWPTLEKLGLMNTMEQTVPQMKANPLANYGVANLKHFGADSFAGHQEIMGTTPKPPVLMPLAIILAEISAKLEEHNHQVEQIYKGGQMAILVDNAIIIGDNMETDLGQVINVSGLLDVVSFEQIKAVGRIVRSIVTVARVIALGGRNVAKQNLLDALYTKDNFIGLDTPASGLYNEDYHVVHMGYGVDKTKQVAHQLHKHGIETIFIGKVGDIVDNPANKNYLGVDTEYLFDQCISAIKQQETGFFCLNIQETDLAGHAMDTEKYAQKLALSDQKLAELITTLAEDDILIVMADHGNDPTIGHSQHTREKVPLLIYKKGLTNRNIGIRDTMADVGATVAEFFGTKISNGTSFLSELE
ncbi:MAG: phosphopentomutase [Culicoidibacterales bacterium]